FPHKFPEPSWNRPLDVVVPLARLTAMSYQMTSDQRRNMTTFKWCLSLLAVAAIGTLAGCSMRSTKTADVSGSVRSSLDQAGLKDVSVTEDHDKGVVTLGGHVAADAEKSQAQSIATSMAGA